MKYRKSSHRQSAVAMAVLQVAIASGVSAGVVEARHHYEQAKVRLGAGDAGGAELLFAQALQEDPDSVAVAMTLTELYVAQHRFDEASALLAPRLKSHSGDYRVWRTLGILKLAQGDEAAAVGAFEAALDKGGREDHFVLVNLQRYYESTGDSARKKQMENLVEALQINGS